jgi:hypothetical protein
MLVEADILATTKVDYDQLHADPTYIPPNSVVIPSVPNQARSDKLSNFIKGVKRDKTQYPELKDIGHFENWQQSFLAVAKSHRIEEVFNPKYTLQAQGKALFEEKQKVPLVFWMTSLKLTWE